LYKSCRILAADQALLDFTHEQPITVSRCAMCPPSPAMSSTGCYDNNRKQSSDIGTLGNR